MTHLRQLQRHRIAAFHRQSLVLVVFVRLIHHLQRRAVVVDALHAQQTALLDSRLVAPPQLLCLSLLLLEGFLPVRLLFRLDGCEIGDALRLETSETVLRREVGGEKVRILARRRRWS